MFLVPYIYVYSIFKYNYGHIMYCLFDLVSLLVICEMFCNVICDALLLMQKINL